MGNLLSSSTVPGTLAPVYSGIDKLRAIFEGSQEYCSSINPQSKWIDAMSNLIEGLLESPATDHCYVAAMHIYKESVSAPFHEFLVFEIVSKTQQPVFMRIDRFVSNPSLDMFTAAQSSAASTTSSATLVPDEKQCRAQHQAQIALSDCCVETTYHKALSASFKPKTASFRRLLDLLNLIANDYDDYNVWDRSCYWFASVVYRTFCIEFPPSEESEGTAHKNLGKFSKSGRGMDWLSAYLDDKGKLFDAWTAKKSKFTPIGKFLRKESGKATLVVDRDRKLFVARTRIGQEFLVFGGEGVLGDNRLEHIAKGDYVADLDGRTIQITNPDSSLLDLSFKSRDEAQTYFSHMRNLMHGIAINAPPAKVRVNRRHSTVLFAQQPSGPSQFDCSSQTLSARPSLKDFGPVDFSLERTSGGIMPVVELCRPLQIVWRDSKQDVVWKQEFIVQSSEGASDAFKWEKYWEFYFASQRKTSNSPRKHSKV